MGQVHATTARGGPAAGIPTCTATGRAGAIATGAGAHDARGAHDADLWSMKSTGFSRGVMRIYDDYVGFC